MNCKYMNSCDINNGSSLKSLIKNMKIIFIGFLSFFVIFNLFPLELNAQFNNTGTEPATCGPWITNWSNASIEQQNASICVGIRNFWGVSVSGNTVRWYCDRHRLGPVCEAPFSASLSTPGCTIPEGQSRCNSSFSLYHRGHHGPTELHRVNPAGYSALQPHGEAPANYTFQRSGMELVSLSSVQSPQWNGPLISLDHGSHTFALSWWTDSRDYRTRVELRRSTAVARCASGLEFRDGVCVRAQTQQPSSVRCESLTANRTSVPASGADVRFSWRVVNAFLVEAVLPSGDRFTVDRAIAAPIDSTASNVLVQNAQPGTYRIIGTGEDGRTSQCSLTLTTGGGITPLPTGANGRCGLANNREYSSPPPMNQRCSAGVVSNFSGNNPWTWRCIGIDRGASVSCRTLLPTTITNPVNGQCGPAHDTTRASAPPVNQLCSQGYVSVTSFGLNGPWTWRCIGIDGGDNVNCSANQVQNPPPTCGSANAGSFTDTPPNNQLCGSGSSLSGSVNTTTSGWSWTCQSNLHHTSGETTTCTANREDPPPCNWSIQRSCDDICSTNESITVTNDGPSGCDDSNRPSPVPNSCSHGEVIINHFTGISDGFSEDSENDISSLPSGIDKTVNFDDELSLTWQTQNACNCVLDGLGLNNSELRGGNNAVGLAVDKPNRGYNTIYSLSCYNGTSINDSVSTAEQSIDVYTYHDPIMNVDPGSQSTVGQQGSGLVRYGETAEIEWEVDSSHTNCRILRGTAEEEECTLDNSGASLGYSVEGICTTSPRTGQATFTLKCDYSPPIHTTINVLPRMQES